MLKPDNGLFSVAERLSVPISTIAHPDDLAIFGTHFGDETYYADYAGIAAKYGPRRILEKRTYRCACCGLELDRDHNAARNILAVGLHGAGLALGCPLL